MDVTQSILDYKLNAAFATDRVDDCHLSLHRQHLTGDVWCVATGPHGVAIRPLITGEMLLRIRAEPSVDRKRAPGSALPADQRWRRMNVDDDVLICFRLDGKTLEFKYVFADGVPFGGTWMELPSASPRSVLTRLREVTGRRGGQVAVGRERK
jgi:hypothetical protein